MPAQDAGFWIFSEKQLVCQKVNILSDQQLAESGKGFFVPGVKNADMQGVDRINIAGKQKGRVMNAAFLSTTVFWLPDLDSNQGPAD